MNKMMAATISPGATTCAMGDSVAAETGVDHSCAHSDEDEEEGRQDLGEQAPPFVAVVPETKLPHYRVRLPH